MAKKAGWALLALSALIAGDAGGGEISAKWFRLTFKQKISWDTGEKYAIRLNEWQLYDTNSVCQSGGLTAVDPSTEPSSMSPGTCLVTTPYTVTSSWAARLFDNTWSGSNNDLYISGIPQGEMSVTNSATWSRVVIRLSDAANPVSSYQMYVGRQSWSGSAGVVVRWSVEASHDGREWFVVDDHSSADGKRPSSNNSPYNGGVPFKLSPPVLPLVGIGASDSSYYDGAYIDDAFLEKTGTVTVAATSGVRVCRMAVTEGTFAVRPENGETVAMSGTVSVGSGGCFFAEGDTAVDRVVCGGSVAVAAGANLVASPGDGETSYFSLGGISGAGGVKKTGAGTLEMDGANTYSGDTVVESGTLRLGKTVARPAKWFRLILMEKYMVPGDADRLDLGEFALYDSDGVQQNKGLVVVASNTADRVMGPGTCKIVSPYAVSGLAYLFDGSTNDTSRVQISGIPRNSSNYAAMSVNSPSTWITITVRLADDALAVVSHNLYLAYQNWEGTCRSPRNWKIEASFDGENWFTVKAGGYMSSPGAPRKWYNGGVPIVLSVADPLPEGALPAASALSVAPGASVVSTNGAALTRLRIDCTAGAGTVDGLSFAPNGALILENDSALGVGVELPITLANITGAENLKTWTVWRGSMPATSTGVKLKDGKLVLYGKGCIIMVL